MSNHLKALWTRLTTSRLDVATEVERITVLQQAAADRRKEFAALKAQATQTEAASLTALSACRRRMEEAESAHIIALQRWENKQARQRSY